MMGHQFYKRTSRGPHWTLEEFYNMYDLPSKKAHDLYYRFGPGSVDLAVLMAAKGVAAKSEPHLGQRRRPHLSP
jgi:hypothetical protein